MSRTTLAHATAAHVQFTLGDLVHIRRYPGWHGERAGHEPIVEARFKNGRLDMSEATLREFVRMGTAALAEMPGDADLSGSVANVGGDE